MVWFSCFSRAKAFKTRRNDSQSSRHTQKSCLFKSIDYFHIQYKALATKPSLSCESYKGWFSNIEKSSSDKSYTHVSAAEIWTCCSFFKFCWRYSYLKFLIEAIEANTEGFLGAVFKQPLVVVLISSQVLCRTKEDWKHRQKKADVLTVNITKQTVLNKSVTCLCQKGKNKSLLNM